MNLSMKPTLMTKYAERITKHYGENFLYNLSFCFKTPLSETIETIRIMLEEIYRKDISEIEEFELFTQKDIFNSFLYDLDKQNKHYLLIKDCAYMVPDPISALEEVQRCMQLYLAIDKDISYLQAIQKDIKEELRKLYFTYKDQYASTQNPFYKTKYEYIEELLQTH